ncbi:G-type lectin S-receptor-like serine/threonine-protein kinase At4g03230 [Hordeum vulgare subsp. vulgare]|uniref:G-type lectin S-receptor-like serine/threonine-protein kinase At4g03230 n=1 Tax=Hordeum vulgare subsp. vulgare TaxID=112509 RepID=UPI001D1A564C|nr:G-type lectin S-receptor-like serine/threonine-protein kinase At4g03230 [Hordeum vulgare subsp. vulgare]
MLWRMEEGRSELSMFEFSQVIDATNNFSEGNKLGEGGFGRVYKGQLPNGLDIAVKRLTQHSGQGLNEFKTEIHLIAKLQHTNLVRLLGYCIEGEEKILIYEYMSNKSLDFFIFDTTRGALLNWNRRRHIIEGVAQGLLYLHKHSRLRVIHRDLKASNILLDENMNPRISDFGLARIFGSNGSHANTSRVVGTHGYMAPEYASEGQFSIKSDVFSFGVLLLEIISGKRNNGFHQTGNIGNLLGYAWLLWKREKWCDLIDPCLDVKHPTMEIMRFINVGLMCVQDDAVDRPTISDAISLLMNESTILPDPKRPAYFRSKGEDTELEEQYSINLLTGSSPAGR